MMSGCALMKAAEKVRDQARSMVISQFGIVGHETAHASGLGEFFVIHSNAGAWNVWTADGL